ncbi:MAG: endonuclease III, partial [Acidobacteria bacterium]|nr:endonuclease III [Acidobacteriota bacterium]
LPQKRWIQFSHQMIHHGRRVCAARNPKCGECRISPVCYAKDRSAS